MQGVPAHGKCCWPWKVFVPIESVCGHGKCPCPWNFSLPMESVPAPWIFSLPMELLPAHGISSCPWNFSLPMEFSLPMARGWNLMISELLPFPKSPKHSLIFPPTFSHVALTRFSLHTFLLPGIPISQICLQITKFADFVMPSNARGLRQNCQVLLAERPSV